MYVEFGIIRGNSENLDFRESSHVLLPEVVVIYDEFGKIRGKSPKISPPEVRGELLSSYIQPPYP